MRMEVEELRIGNIYLEDGKESIVSNGYDIYRIDELQNPSLSGIQVTKDILVRLGFLNSDKYSLTSNSGHTLSLKPDDLQWNVYYNDQLLFTRFMAVHELQNLAYELLKVELTIKETA